MYICLTVNGKPVNVTVHPGRRLVDVLRMDLGLTGTKIGCEQGECGACTVLLDGRAVNSCLVLMSQVEGREVLTIEGLTDDGELHALQQAFVDTGAVQCGFCSPGFLMSAYALLSRNPHPSRDEIVEAVTGNLCRCTGYRKIFQAIERVAGCVAARTEEQ
ncbi:MAG: (2Fe-2S)-binding protein [Candidatus Eisenbacteria sp.]|nr:(2Fe-2S)-binding protein [Candidatus Eisenbacteria bacterium]